MDIVVVNDDCKFVGGADEFDHVDVVPGELFEDVVVDAGIDAVFGR